jgi:hypothetical protein
VFEAFLTRDTAPSHGYSLKALRTDRLATGVADPISASIDPGQSGLDCRHLPPPLLVEGGERHLGGFLLDAISTLNVTIRVHGKHGVFHVKNTLHQLLLEFQQALPIRLKHLRVHKQISLYRYYRDFLTLLPQSGFDLVL